MKPVSLDGRLAELARQLEAGDGVAALEILGALLRRREQLGQTQRQRLDALRQEARASIDAAALEGVEPGALEREIRALAPRGAAALALLERRETLEAVLLAALDLGLTGEPLQRLQGGLARIDPLGRQKIAAFLQHNPARRTAREELDAGAREAWWWDLRVGCDVEALAALSGDLLQAGPRAELERHLAGCEHCQEDLRWLGELDAVLGTPDEEHPSPAELVRHAAGEGEAGWRQRIARHLEGCPACQRLRRGAAAGLAEAGRVEAGLALLAAATPAETSPLALHQTLSLPAPSQARALAAEPAVDASPLPEERRLLLEEPGRHRLVLWVVAGRCQLALVADDPGGVELEVTLDGEAVAVTEEEPEARVFELGPARQVAGRTLEVELEGTRRSWTLVLEPPDEDDGEAR